MVSKAKGLKGVIFMDYPAWIFLGGWQLGTPSGSGALDAVRKVRDTSELVSWWADVETGFSVHLAGPSQSSGDLHSSRENVLAFPRGWVVPSPGELSGCWDVCITLLGGHFHKGQSFGFVWPSWAQVGGDSIPLASTGQIAASLTKALCCSWACSTFLLGDTSGTSFLLFKFIVSVLSWLSAPHNFACCSSSDVRKNFLLISVGTGLDQCWPLLRGLCRELSLDSIAGEPRLLITTSFVLCWIPLTQPYNILHFLLLRQRRSPIFLLDSGCLRAVNEDLPATTSLPWWNASLA